MRNPNHRRYDTAITTLKNLYSLKEYNLHNDNQLLKIVLDHIHIGVMIVDTHLKIHFTNHEAERILTVTDGIYRQQGTLSIKSQASAKTFKSYIKTLSDHSDTSDSVQQSAAFSVMIPRQDNPTPLTLELTDIYPDSGPTPETNPCILVFISDPALNRTPLENLSHWFHTHFCLTKRESRVASLCLQGHSADQIAAMDSKSRETIRSQLKQVFCKLDVHSQIELIVQFQHRLPIFSRFTRYTYKAPANVTHKNISVFTHSG